jgi:RNA polymerase sigma factor (sigma-70 family)
MRKADSTVFVVDDDAALCEALQWLLESAGFRVRTHRSAEAFLAAYDREQPGCLVLDVRLRGMSGLDLQRKLNEQQIALPVIVLSGHGDIPMAVRAIQAGALDFLEKPVDDTVLLGRIRLALALDSRQRSAVRAQAELRARLQSLTPREREVLELVLAGRPNKEIAAELGVAVKTVEAHRKHLMEKMDVRHVVELVRAVMTARATVDGQA